MNEYYKILRLEDFKSSDITPELILKQYRLLSKEYHPDLGGDEELFKLLNEAYEELKKYHSKNHNKPKSSTVTEYDKDMYVVDISLDDYIKKKTIKVSNFYVDLPYYYTPFITFRKNESLVTVNINLTDRYFYANKYKFRYTVIEGIAVTILEDDDAFDKIINEMVVITPRGIKGLTKKPKLSGDHFIIKDHGLPVETPSGTIMNSILIISKEKSKN